jgi:hypothetical protein
VDFAACGNHATRLDEQGDKKMKNMATYCLYLLCAFGVAMSGCNSEAPEIASGAGNSANSPPALQPPMETFSYYARQYRLGVDFRRSGSDPAWALFVFDGRDVRDQAIQAELQGKDMAWTPSECRCVTAECVAVIDQALADFAERKPGAKVEYLALEMQVDREFWSEMLSSLKTNLASEHREMSLEESNPQAVVDAVDSVAKTSSAIADVKRVLARHGLRTTDIRNESPIEFKIDKHRKWSDLAALAGSGVFVPGILYFELTGQLH